MTLAAGLDLSLHGVRRVDVDDEPRGLAGAVELLADEEGVDDVGGLRVGRDERFAPARA